MPPAAAQISWPDREGSVFMTGPAEAVFDGVVVPELVPVPIGQPSKPPAATQAAQKTSARSATFDCSRDCQDGCRQPDNCLRAEAQQQVQSLLDSMSLDAMINLASTS